MGGSVVIRRFVPARRDRLLFAIIEIQISANAVFEFVHGMAISAAQFSLFMEPKKDSITA
jgi:hypothetical protein